MSCSQAMSVKRSAFRKAYFRALGYTTMRETGKRSFKFPKLAMATSRLTEPMTKVESQAEHQDLSYWKTVNTSKICS